MRTRGYSLIGGIKSADTNTAVWSLDIWRQHLNICKYIDLVHCISNQDQITLLIVRQGVFFIYFFLIFGTSFENFSPFHHAGRNDSSPTSDLFLMLPFHMVRTPADPLIIFPLVCLLSYALLICKHCTMCKSGPWMKRSKKMAKVILRLS